MKLYRVSLARRIVLPILRLVNPGDITVRHHWAPERYIILHSFRHKGYWFHGRNREHKTMLAFGRLIRRGDVVVEVGAHIGYVSIYFSELVGPDGQVFAFEPGPNNLPYLQKNVSYCRNVEVIDKAVSDHDGTATLTVENITGQNNSLIPDYYVFECNRRNAFVNERSMLVDVNTVALDNFLDSRQTACNFVKIDVEGAERQVIEGMMGCIKTKPPKMMVEVTMNEEAVYAMLTRAGYWILDESLRRVQGLDQLSTNWFCLHPAAHREVLQQLWQERQH